MFARGRSDDSIGPYQGAAQSGDDGRGQTSVFAARTFAVAANFESRRMAKPNWTRPLAAGVAAAQPWRRQRRDVMRLQLRYHSDIDLSQPYAS